MTAVEQKPANTGPQTPTDWHNAVANPTPEMLEQAQRLQEAVERARAKREGSAA